MKITFLMFIQRHRYRSDNDVQMVKTIELPFVPHVGMQLIDGDWHVKVTAVTWKATQVITATSNGAIICEVESDIPPARQNRWGVKLPDDVQRTPENMSEAIREAEAVGWQNSTGGVLCLKPWERNQQ